MSAIMIQPGPELELLTPDSTPDWDRIKFEVHCPRCGYNLRTLTRPKCPECAAEFDWLSQLAMSSPQNNWLFEVGWKRTPVRSYFLTVARSFRPRCFWARVSTYQPVRLLPLSIILFSAILLFLLAYPLVAWLIGETIRLTVNIRQPFWDINTRPPRFGFPEFMWYISATFIDTPHSFLSSNNNAAIAVFSGVVAMIAGTTYLIRVFGRLLGGRPVRFVDATRIMAYSAVPACLWGSLILLIPKSLSQ